MYKNNTWVEVNYSPTVVVFVHGILSSSETCWWNSQARVSWPDLVLNDPEFKRPSVFVAGYPADVFTGDYLVYDAAEELIARLRTQYDRRSPMRKPKMLFVCHSQGGLVVRQMLVACTSEFRQKKVGLVLCGSPGWGSVLGTLAKPLTSLLRFKQAAALAWGSESLVALDRDYLRVIRNKEIPDLHGKSLIETRGLWGLPKIVSGASATRYFPDWNKIPKSNHFQIVKPDGPGHMSHVYLRQFANNSGFIADDVEFDIYLNSLLPAEKNRCQELKGAFRSPNIVRVLLCIEQGLARQTLLPSERATLDQLVEAYEAGLQGRSGPPYVDFSWRDVLTIQKAMELAAQESAEQVCERHLWRAVLEVPSRTLSELDRKIGEKALQRLRARAQDSPWLRVRTRFNE